MLAEFGCLTGSAMISRLGRPEAPDPRLWSRSTTCGVQDKRAFEPRDYRQITLPLTILVDAARIGRVQRDDGRKLVHMTVPSLARACTYRVIESHSADVQKRVVWKVSERAQELIGTASGSIQSATKSLHWSSPAIVPMLQHWETATYDLSRRRKQRANGLETKQDVGQLFSPAPRWAIWRSVCCVRHLIGFHRRPVRLNVVPDQRRGPDKHRLSSPKLACAMMHMWLVLISWDQLQRLVHPQFVSRQSASLECRRTHHIMQCASKRRTDLLAWPRRREIRVGRYALPGWRTTRPEVLTIHSKDGWCSHGRIVRLRQLSDKTPPALSVSCGRGERPKSSPMAHG
nr:hypothetical protein CFP56_54527 [Quercus suber]